MPIKYECPKCGRRFTEWGAEKVGFKCPKDQWCTKEHPDDVELLRVGSSEEGPSRRPTLKRTPRKIAQPKPAVELDEDEALVPDIEELDTEDEFDEEEDEVLAVDEDDGEEEGDSEETDDEVAGETVDIEDAKPLGENQLT